MLLIIFSFKIHFAKIFVNFNYVSIFIVSVVWLLNTQRNEGIRLADKSEEFGIQRWADPDRFKPLSDSVGRMLVRSNGCLPFCASRWASRST